MSPPLQGCHKHGNINPCKTQVGHYTQQGPAQLMQLFASQVSTGLGGNLGVCNETQAIGIFDLVQITSLVFGS